jgi:hypothetical protein
MHSATNIIISCVFGCLIHHLPRRFHVSTVNGIKILRVNLRAAKTILGIRRDTGISGVFFYDLSCGNSRIGTP